MSTETEYYQEKENMKKKKKKKNKGIQNIVAIFKVNSISSIFLFLCLNKIILTKCVFII